MNIITSQTDPDTIIIEKGEGEYCAMSNWEHNGTTVMSVHSMGFWEKRQLLFDQFHKSTLQ